VKDGIFHDRICFAIGHLAILRDLDRPLAEIDDGLQFHLVRNQLTDRLTGRENMKYVLGET